MTLFEESLAEHVGVCQQIRGLLPQIERVAERLQYALKSGGKLLLMGNGGSAADCQHTATELMVRMHVEREPLPAIALTTDSSILTATANDWSFDLVFARQVQALCAPDDVVIGLSTSGRSANILRAFEVARELEAYRVGFTGQTGERLRHLVDECICIPSEHTARIQEAHMLVLHMICESLERRAGKHA
ncbi:SIS domain-containing protein [Myxococcota bacterium]